MKSCVNIAVAIIVALVAADSVVAGSFGNRLLGRNDCCQQQQPQIVGYRYVPAPCRPAPAPVISRPICTTPIISAPIYTAPVTYSAPIVSAPARRCCKCCCCCCCCCGSGHSYLGSGGSFQLAEDVTYDSFAGALDTPTEAEISSEGVFVEGDMSEMPSNGYVDGESIDGIFDNGSMSDLPIEDVTPANNGPADMDADNLTDGLEDALGDKDTRAQFPANTRLVFIPKKRSQRSSAKSGQIVTSSRKRSGQSQVRLVRNPQTNASAKRFATQIKAGHATGFRTGKEIAFKWTPVASAIQPNLATFHRRGAAIRLRRVFPWLAS